MTELSVLMPAFNERGTVERAIAAVLDADLGVDGLELLVVDDGSTDGTGDILAQTAWPANVRIFSHRHNLGKGAAIRTALDSATGTYATVFDADLEYDAQQIAQMLEPLRTGEKAVFGIRGFQSHSAYNFWYVVGNKGVTLAANLLYNSWVADIMSCHKAMPTDVFRSLDLRERGFTIEAEITAKLLRTGVRIYEVPVTYRARSRESGKKLTAIDGLRVLAALIKYRVA
jgi:glycosyltransferase involved in cell wall biosynthesis